MRLSCALRGLDVLKASSELVGLWLVYDWSLVGLWLVYC